MIIHTKLGNLNDFAVDNRIIDTLPVDWYETKKRILHKQTAAGRSIILKFLNEAPELMQGDVIVADETHVVYVDVIPCDAIVIKPTTMQEMASVCYEIGNKHLPLFYQDEEILVPYEAPLFRMLEAGGLTVVVQKRKLLHSLKTSVTAHNHNSNGSLFSKILQLTNASSNA